jgi:hypothetical protein
MMIVSRITNVDFSLLPGGVVLACLVLVVYRIYFHRLHGIPGPAVASCSNLWRLYQAWKRRPELVHLALHEKYGPLVRIGPNAISVSDPKAISIIYALNGGFSKSDFYTVQQTLKKGTRLFTLFTSTDEKFHAKLRRAVSNAYAMSTLVQFEPYIDSTTHAFLNQMKSRMSGKPEILINLSTWLQWYAFDVIGELTFSKRLGFLDRGEDVEGIIASIEKMLDYAAVVSVSQPSATHRQLTR